MKIETFFLHPYTIPLVNGKLRPGVLITLIDEKGNSSWGDIAPLSGWSRETLDDALKELSQKKLEIIAIQWTPETCLQELGKLQLLPSVSFGLESALFSLLMPLAAHTVQVSALLMGSVQEILEQAKLRQDEGYTSAKLKVSNLTFEEAAHVIHRLKDKFRLRIDVNRAWNTRESLRFFSEFPLDAFDYVEEPFQNPHDLAQFLHPLAIDESFPYDLSLRELESLPQLKAVIYKPTLQGGMLGCLTLHEWTKKRGLSLVLSSSFESDLGLAHIASLAHRLSLSAPLGIGTYHHLGKYMSSPALQFSASLIHIPAHLTGSL
jgi:O-succinylbenzoate synthase